MHSEIFDTNDKKVLYKILAQINHFINTDETIYLNANNERFVLTKYGFKPVEEVNLKLLNKKLYQTIEILKTENLALLNQVKKQQNINANLQLSINKMKKTNKTLSNKVISYCDCGSIILFRKVDDVIESYCDNCNL
jgi:actin-related protein